MVAREDRGRVRGVAGPQDVGRLGAARVARREDVAFRRRVPQNMRTIFKEPAIKLITDAKLVLERWKQSYMTMRQRCECLSVA